MSQYYVCGMRFRYYQGPMGRGARKARKATPVCYGPFANEQNAQDWKRNRGTIHMTIDTQKHGDFIEVKETR